MHIRRIRGIYKIRKLNPSRVTNLQADLYTCIFMAPVTVPHDQLGSIYVQSAPYPFIVTNDHHLKYIGTQTRFYSLTIDCKLDPEDYKLIPYKGKIYFNNSIEAEFFFSASKAKQKIYWNSNKTLTLNPNTTINIMMSGLTHGLINKLLFVDVTDIEYIQNNSYL